MLSSATRLLMCTLLGLILCGCDAGPADRSRPAAPAPRNNDALVRYATGFDIQQREGFRLLTVKRPWPGAQRPLRYALLPRNAATAGDGRAASHADIRLPPDAVVIKTPIRSIATFSASFVAPLEILGVSESWLGHDRPERVYAGWARRRVEQGKVARLGEQADADIERLLTVGPDLVMINEYEPAGPLFARLAAAGLPVLVSGDWLEASPLGRAEWIKVFGLLYDRWDRATAVFREVEANYLDLAAIGAAAAERPTVLSNAPFGGTWSVPAGESYTARLFRDAGADYLWANSAGTGALHLDLEQVFVQARQADVWINPGAWRTLADGERQDPRLGAFTAFREGRVFNFDNRTAAGGGNDFFESGPYRPHVVLADLISILHPQLLPDHRLYYYRRVPR